MSSATSSSKNNNNEKDTTRYDVEILTLLEKEPCSKDSGLGTKDIRRAYPMLFRLDSVAGVTIRKRLARLKAYSWRSYMDAIVRTNTKKGSNIKISKYTQQQVAKEKTFILKQQLSAAMTIDEDLLSVYSMEGSEGTEEEVSEEETDGDDYDDDSIGLSGQFLGMAMASPKLQKILPRRSPGNKSKSIKKSGRPHDGLTKFQRKHGDGSNAAPIRFYAAKNCHVPGLAIGSEKEADFANGTQLMPAVSIVTEANAADRTKTNAYLMGAQLKESVSAKVKNVPKSLKGRTIIVESPANSDHLYKLLPGVIAEDATALQVHKQIAANLSKIATNSEGKMMYIAVHFPEVANGFLTTHESIDPLTFKIRTSTHKIWKEVSLFNRDGTNQVDSNGDRIRGWIFLPALQWILYENERGFKGPIQVGIDSEEEFA
jgi:hypothetical protein